MGKLGKVTQTRNQTVCGIAAPVECPPSSASSASSATVVLDGQVSACVQGSSSSALSLVLAAICDCGAPCALWGVPDPLRGNAVYHPMIHSRRVQCGKLHLPSDAGASSVEMIRAVPVATLYPWLL